MKINCWEHKKCGREPGGENVQQFGVCPVAVQQEFDSAHGGKNAGRSCWIVAGSLCGGKIQGTYAEKLSNCWRCDFMNMVKNEEEKTPLGFSYTQLGIKKILERQHARVGAAGQLISTD